MLTKSKLTKLHNSLKKYSKQYLHKKLTELDESGTRLMINSFLTDVLGFIPIEEVKTEYMIRGTYADYVIQLKGNRHFLVEVKSLSLNLSAKHLRQTVNYGANEGIDWALLTNGKSFDFYKILFTKPIDAIKVFSFNLSETDKLKNCLESLQYLHKDSVSKKGLDILWNKSIAMNPKNLAGYLYADPVVNFLKRSLGKKYKNKFSNEEIKSALSNLITCSIEIDSIQHSKSKNTKKSQLNSRKTKVSSIKDKLPIKGVSKSMILN